MTRFLFVLLIIVPVFSSCQLKIGMKREMPVEREGKLKFYRKASVRVNADFESHVKENKYSEVLVDLEKMKDVIASTSSLCTDEVKVSLEKLGEKLQKARDDFKLTTHYKSLATAWKSLYFDYKKTVSNEIDNEKRANEENKK